MDVIPVSSNDDWIAFQIFTYTSNICVQLLFNLFINERLPVFCRKNNMDVIPDQ